MPKKKKIDWNKPENFLMQFTVENLDIENRTLELSITSETMALRWFGYLLLGHDPGECRLERVKTVGSFLFAHGRDPNYGLIPIGPILDVWLDESKSPRQYRAKLKFDDDEKSDLLFQKVQKGSLKGVSVGVRFYKVIEIEPNEEKRGFKGPFYLAIDWDISEISLEPIPELIVGVGLSMDETDEGAGIPGNLSDIKLEQEDNKMEFEVTRNGVKVKVKESELTSEERILLGLDQQTQNTDLNSQSSAANTQTIQDNKVQLAVERKRQQDIRALCETFNVSNEDRDRFLNGDFSVSDVQKFVLDKLSNERRGVPVATITVDERDKFRAAAIDGLTMRTGLELEKPAPGAQEFRGVSLLSLAEECAEKLTGKSFRRATPEEKIKAALGFNSDGQFMGASDFPNILSNVANKSMSTAYAAAPTTYQEWTRRGSLSDFKAASRLTLSYADELEEIKKNGEFKVVEYSEKGRTIQLGTYGARWGLNRQAIINDDLDALSLLPVREAVAARRLINKTVYKILTSNQQIDGDDLFHSTHGNLLTGAELSVAALGKMRAAMAKQKDISGKQVLNIRLANLIVPEELSLTAEQLVASTVDPSKNNAVPNPFNNKLKVISEPELDASSTTAWYGAGAPGVTDTIEVAFLNGRDQPTIEYQVSFDILGIAWRIYIDFGVALLDWRALAKNPGPQ